MTARHTKTDRAAVYRRLALGAAAVLTFLCVATLAAWLIDEAMHRNKVPRNVAVAGQPVGGQSSEEARETVARLAAQYPQTRVNIRSGETTIETTAEALGVTVDVEATTAEIMRSGDGAPWSEFARWFGSLRSTRKVPLIVKADSQKVLDLIRAQPGAVTDAPTEPTIRAGAGGFEVVDGKPGRGINPTKLTEALQKAPVRDGAIEVKVAAGPIPPLLDRSAAESAARQADRLTNRPLPIRAGTAVAAIDEETLRTWIRPKPGPANIDLGINTDLLETVQETIEEKLESAGEAAREATVTGTAGGFVVTESAGGMRCCDPKAARLVLDTFSYGTRESPTDLPLTPTEPAHTTTEAMSVREPVATFTTHHTAGEPRVQNIHRIADLVNGAVIWPAESFSLNKYVGPRTTKKGFVEAPVIYKGKFEKDVGGGVSQFATTLFNAAFFAGLDFNEYQAHTIYISRYPYGREATLSYPAPDLSIRNTTPYAIYVQTSYTASDITITLWSTPYVTAAQTGQTKRQVGNCTRVTTERTRTYLDGRTKVDTVGAIYQPEEKILCN